MPYFAVSDKVSIHMNVKRLGQDMHEFIEYLGLHDVTVIERIFDDVGFASWEIAKVMNPALASVPPEYESGMHAISRDSQAPLTFASLMEKPHESAESVKKFMKAQA